MHKVISDLKNYTAQYPPQLRTAVPSLGTFRFDIWLFLQVAKSLLDAVMVIPFNVNVGRY
jgi:hypothetical protein